MLAGFFPRRFLADFFEKEKCVRTRFVSIFKVPKCPPPPDTGGPDSLLSLTLHPGPPPLAGRRGRCWGCCWRAVARWWTSQRAWPASSTTQSSSCAASPSSSPSALGTGQVWVPLHCDERSADSSKGFKSHHKGQISAKLNYLFICGNMYYIYTHNHVHNDSKHNLYIFG